MFSYRMKYVAFIILAANFATAQAEQPASYGVGRAADASEIAVWDKDVVRMALGLPAGSGSVALGEQLYGEKCVACHGSEGTGGAL
jgi:cytochrome c